MSSTRVLLVQPSSYDLHGRVIKSRLGFVPPRTMPYLAAMTPPHFEVRIVDEAVEDLDLNTDADLVALTGMLHHIPRAIDIGRHFRHRGIKTVIGGVGAYAAEEQVRASQAFDSVVHGEAESVWNVVLDDWAAGRLKERYDASTAPDIARIPFARFDLLRLDRYVKWPPGSRMPVLPIETSRGCPNNCRYCLVTRYFGRKMRYREIGDVLDELRHQGARQYLFSDDNIAANPNRARELFLAIKPLKIQWIGQFESRIARQPELLRLAAESGCRSAFVGVESLNADNLAAMGKSQNSRIGLKELSEAFRSHGIIIMASLIFGLDNDTPESIRQTVEQLIDHDIDTLIPWMLTPIPKTPVYDEYKTANRLVHENYSLYDAIHAVIRPKGMDTKCLEETYWRSLRRFYGVPAILRRVLHAKKSRLVELIYNLRVRRQVRRGLHPFSNL